MILDKERVTIASKVDVPKLDLSKRKADEAPIKGRSLFSRHLEQKGLKVANSKKPCQTPIAHQSLSNHHHHQQQLITGEGVGNRKEAELIHSENVQLLASMTQEEILSEKEKLMCQLDPKLLAYMRNKSAKHQQPLKAVTTGQEPAVSAAATQPPEQAEQAVLKKLPFEVDSRWLHMDKVEPAKLAWMMADDATNATTSSSEKRAHSARFDFDGNLLGQQAHEEEEKKDDQSALSNALYHHGNEPDLPGYSLDELFHLARSKFNQQRVLALKTLANIVQNCHTDAYCAKIKVSRPTTTTTTDGAEEANAADDKRACSLLSQLIEGGLVYLARTR